MEPEGSVLYSQEPATGSRFFHFTPVHPIQVVSFLKVSIPNPCMHLFSFMLATCLMYLILLDLIILITFMQFSPASCYSLLTSILYKSLLMFFFLLSLSSTFILYLRHSLFLFLKCLIIWLLAFHCSYNL
jgi:hypothetical protein